jgi:hypothetical protein
MQLQDLNTLNYPLNTSRLALMKQANSGKVIEVHPHQKCLANHLLIRHEAPDTAVA